MTKKEKPCINCGTLTKNGRMCYACYQYFKKGGIIHPLPEFATVGYTNDDKVICHICGMAYSKLSEHIRRKHHLSMDEYRDRFGLQKNARLTSMAYRNKMRNHTIKNKTYMKNFEAVISGEKRGKHSRLGKKQSPQEIEARREEQRRKGRLSKSKMTDARKKEMGKIWIKNLSKKGQNHGQTEH